MKNYHLLILAIIFLFFNQSIAQEPTKVNAFGLTQETPFLINQFVVIKKDNLTVQDGYKLVLEWVNMNYDTPKEVTKSQLENEYIIMEGVNVDFVCMDGIVDKTCFDTKYSTLFEFRENEIQIQVLKIELLTKLNNYGWFDQKPDYYNLTQKNGNPKKNMIDIADGLTLIFNNVHNDLTDYLNNPMEVQQ